MKTIKIKIKMMMTVTFLLSLLCGKIFAQTLINNAGGIIENETGIIKIKTTGSLLDMPDTLGGTIMFLAKDAGRAQVIPNITYTKLIVDAFAWMSIDSMDGIHAYQRPMSILDSFVVLSGNETKLRNNHIETHAKGHIFNNGAIRGRMDVVMKSETTKQTIDGDNQGSFSRLRIENPHNVEVVGGFTVTNKLELQEGELINDNVNFNLGDNAINRSDTNDTYLERPLIVRHSGASVRVRPALQENDMDIHYTGDGVIYSGGEVPEKDKNIFGLRAANTDSLILTENIEVKDNIYIGTHIHTVEQDTLTLASIKNPDFHPNNPQAEVHGNFRRTGWRDGDTIVFNNPMTKLFFRTPVSRSSISQLVSTIYPSRYHQLAEASREKVKRQITLKALNPQNVEYTDTINATYGYGWRHRGDYDETFNLAFERLKLLHYDSNGSKPWIINEASVVPPQNNSLGRWGHSHTVDIRHFGIYAIGYGIYQPYLAFTGRAFLEGAYFYGQERMGNELQKRRYLPMPPPNIYPYNTDPNRNSYVRADGQFPDSVVDWVVLEFRRDFAIEGRRKTFLLRTDGAIVDMWGNEVALFNDDGTFANTDSLGNAPPPQDTIRAAQFYVLLLHRNHAAVISNQPIAFAAGENIFVDFTLPSTVLGGINSLKPIDRVRDPLSPGIVRHLYGMIAGDINNGLRPDGMIDVRDYNAIIRSWNDWSIETLDGYLLEDINLNGTINTLDFNIVFNNRNRKLWYMD